VRILRGVQVRLWLLLIAAPSFSQSAMRGLNPFPIVPFRDVSHGHLGRSIR